jgi:hypothetical protein
MPPRNNGGKSMLGGAGLTTAVVSNYLSEINLNTYTKANVKNVEDVQQIIGYFNHVIADIQAKKKKM